MAKRTVTANKAADTEKLISQIFKVDAATYRNVRLLAAARTGSNRPATGQAIYLEALREYLERNAEEVEAVSA